MFFETQNLSTCLWPPCPCTVLRPLDNTSNTALWNLTGASDNSLLRMDWICFGETFAHRTPITDYFQCLHPSTTAWNAMAPCQLYFLWTHCAEDLVLALQWGQNRLTKIICLHCWDHLGLMIFTWNGPIRGFLCVTVLKRNAEVWQEKTVCMLQNTKFAYIKQQWSHVLGSWLIIFC